MSIVRVLGADYCPFCVKVKNYLQGQKVKFDWIDTQTPEGQSQRSNLSTQYKWKTIPMVFVKGEFVGGCDDFFAKLQSNKINLNA